MKKAQIDFGYTKVKAPISGFTSLNKQDLGSYVGSTNESMILTTITQTNPIYVEFSLPDIEFLKKRFIMNNGNWNNFSQTSLLQDTTGAFVYIAKDNEAVRTSVKIENISKDTYIINDGLNEGDIVITNNLTKLKSGSPITLMSKE